MRNAEFKLDTEKCNGCGTVMSTYSAELISKNKAAMRLLKIPEGHRFMTVVGFGYPKYRYARGIDKHRKVNKIFWFLWA